MAGFFKRALGAETTLSPREEMKEAVAYFVVMMNWSASGDIDDAVMNATLNTIARCNLFADNNQEEDLQLLIRLEDKLKADANGNAAHYARILERDDWKYTAASLMADVMMADGLAEQSEINVLLTLATDVGIPEAELEAIVATTRALRRTWTEE